ncbi:hypothetical protein QP705_00115 [Limosilactobacillus reuteri]|uniref:hypothetical protein n=1 Tax=Limosilactobacillus reuteri TaxID=1598 RepID=UPI002551A57C|nr:hypothetical protein [Limosilactobacillus reuteri]MDK8115608.1 hypothetical protein [Limosilactobacillus reuteri]
MKKVIIIITSVVVGLFILIRIPINLRNNAYYYATHMPHKRNQYPFVPILSGHFLPGNDVSEYKAENTGSTRGPIKMDLTKRSIQRNGDLLEIDEKSAVYSLKPSGQITGDNYGLYFSNNGKVEEEIQKNIPNYSRKLIYDELNKIQNEIKQNTPKPKVNLQWIWNIWFRIHYR